MKSTRINLAGAWNFALGIDSDFNDTIILPSTTEVSKKGVETEKKDETNYLTRKRPFTGVSKYRKTVNIPEDWRNKKIHLFLERTKYTRLLIDGKIVSESHETLIPQKHYLPDWVNPGNHEVIIEVDNDLSSYDDFSDTLYNGHQYTEHTQTNWNGILGDIYLEANHSIEIKAVTILGGMKNHSFEVNIEIENTNIMQEAFVEISYKSRNKKSLEDRIEKPILLKSGTNSMGFVVHMKEMLLWNEFQQNLYDIQIIVYNKENKTIYHTTTGFREARIQEENIIINGENISLRGSLDCCIYPLTGHAPMSREEWIDIFKQLKAYGLNHYRFHSWCPSKAAFEAADLEGIYLQIELSCFANGFYEQSNPLCDMSLNQYLYDQSKKVIKEYGNHPSFLIFAVGNEMIGDINEFNLLLKYLKNVRQDKLYTQGANNFLENPICAQEDDIWVTMRTSPADNIRGSFSHGDKPLGHIQRNEPYDTMYEYSKELKNSKIPVIAHEVGQFQTYPNFNEISKYTGVTESTALKIFKERLKKAGMEHQAEDFYFNSGNLSVQCYKEEIEALLRTDKLGGFQLLGLQDFPGQGTALIGLWDSFMESKGFISSDQWREFCSPQVVLLKMKKGIFESGESVKGEVWVYNFGTEEISGEFSIAMYTHCEGDERKETFYSLIEKREDDILLETVTLKGNPAPKGKLTYIGDFELEIKASQSTVAAYLEVRCGSLKNHYPIWIYQNKGVPDSRKVLILDSLTEEGKQALKQGKNVLLFSTEEENSIEGFFAPDFWCYPMFKAACEGKGAEIAPGTLGLLCKKEHPALKYFPTERFSSWQWKQITCNSRPHILHEDKDMTTSIVQVIDNFHRNHKLSLIYEKNMFQGKLLVCTVDLRKHLNMPEMKGLYYSLLKYLDQ